MVKNTVRQSGKKICTTIFVPRQETPLIPRGLEKSYIHVMFRNNKEKINQKEKKIDNVLHMIAE